MNYESVPYYSFMNISANPGKITAQKRIPTVENSQESIKNEYLKAGDGVYQKIAKFHRQIRN